MCFFGHCIIYTAQKKNEIQVKVWDVEAISQKSLGLSLVVPFFGISNALYDLIGSGRSKQVWLS